MSEQEQPPGHPAPNDPPPPGPTGTNKRIVLPHDGPPVSQNQHLPSKRDIDKDYKFGTSTQSVRSDVIHEAIPITSETPKFHHRNRYSDAPINFKAIDRTIEPYLNHTFSNKYQYLTHSFGGRTLLHEVQFKLHYHLLAYIFAIDQRSKTHDGNLELDQFSSYIHAKLRFENLKVDAFMAPIFEMIADYQPEMHDITDLVKCFVYTNFADNPVTGDTQYVIPNQARFTTPDFQGMFRMVQRLITQTNDIAQANVQQVFTAMWNMTDPAANAAQQHIGDAASLRHSLYPLLPGQPFTNRMYQFGDPAQQGIGGNAHQGSLYLNAQKEFLQQVGYPPPIEAGDIATVAKWCGLHNRVDWVLANQSLIYPATFSEGNNTLVNLAQLRKTTLSWRIEKKLSDMYQTFLTALNEHALRCEGAHLERMRERRGLMDDGLAYLRATNAFDNDNELLRVRGQEAEAAFTVGIRAYRIQHPEVPNAGINQPVDFIARNNIPLDRFHYGHQDPIGQFIAQWARANGIQHLWDHNQYVTPERSQNIEGLKELAVYQLYHPAVGAYISGRDEPVRFRGPFYNHDHLPIRYTSIIENEYGSYRAAVVSHYQTRARR